MPICLNPAIVTSIQAIGRAFPVEKIVLFGSRARGDHKPKSDMDFAIYPKAEMLNERLLREAFDELPTLLKYDLVIIDAHTNPELLEAIQREGVPIYARS